MTCKLITEQMHDYLACDLIAEQRASFESHVASCDACSQRVDEQRILLERLSAYGAANMPAPDANFFDRSIAQAVSTGNRQARKRWIMSGFGGAMAAAFAIWMIGGMFFNTPLPEQTQVPGVTMALEEPKTLNLVFSSAGALADATMTVMLPAGIEIEGFRGQRQITWMTSLTEGRNVLPLTLIATSAHGGELLATLQHEGDDRSFTLQVNVLDI